MNRARHTSKGGMEGAPTYAFIKAHPERLQVIR